jgi:CBS domain-containing protein
MIRLRDIMTTEVVTIPFDVSIREAMSILSSRHISGAPVTDGTGLAGVVTATDLMAFAAELPGAPVETSPADAFEELEADTDQLEPPGEEPLATFFTELWEDAGADAAVRMALTNGAEWNVLDEHTVAEAMTRAPLLHVSSTTSVEEAAECMRQHNVRRLLVMDGERVVGIVTATDITNAVADHKLRERAYVFGRESHFTGSPETIPRAPTLGEQLHRR